MTIFLDNESPIFHLLKGEVICREVGKAKMDALVVKESQNSWFFMFIQIEKHKNR